MFKQLGIISHHGEWHTSQKTTSTGVDIERMGPFLTAAADCSTVWKTIRQEIELPYDPLILLLVICP